MSSGGWVISLWLTPLSIRVDAYHMCSQLQIQLTSHSACQKGGCCY